MSKMVLMWHKKNKVPILKNNPLPVVLILSFLVCSYFRTHGNDQTDYSNIVQMRQETSTEIPCLYSGNKNNNRPILQTGSLFSIPHIGITAGGKYLLKGAIAGILLLLISSIVWQLVYRSRFRRIYAELDIKDKMLEDLNEKREQALSRIRNIESDLINIKETARQTDKLKDEFISNISHEIRTPMNAIVGLTSFLNNPEITRAEAEDYIEAINSSCKQLLTVIDDIVDISKIESGQLTIMVEEVNLNDILRDLYSIYRDQGKLKNIDLGYSSGLTDDRSQIRTDGLRIRQVFRNLLNNAFKFTEAGNIEFGYFPDDGKITFYVKDDGIGIPPENQSLIFDRFWQAESSVSRSHEGLGLGLSISKKIVEKMGGTIRVESEPGSGSVFYFFLPLEENKP